MGKPPSGLFHSTKGELAYYGDAEAVIARRVAGLDLREHPLGRRQLSSATRAKIKKKIAARTATREEYEHYMWDKRLARRREHGVRRFWEAERNRLADGESGTRNWSKSQTNAILSNIRPSFNGKTIQAHHTFSVSLYPHLADKSEVMYPATPYEHLKGWHGGNYRKSLSGKAHSQNQRILGARYD